MDNDDLSRSASRTERKYFEHHAKVLGKRNGAKVPFKPSDG